MGTFSLSKLSDSLRRKLSDAQSLRLSQSNSVERNSYNQSIFDLETSTGSSCPTRRDQSIDSSPRSRSRSVSKKEAKILIRQETTQVILKKLLHILEDCGVHLPITLNTKVDGPSGHQDQGIKLHVANSSDCIFLPAARTKASIMEDFAMGRESGSDMDSIYLSLNDELFSDNSLNPDETAFGQRTRTAVPSNYLCSPVESEAPIPHLFAVIVEVGPGSVNLGSIEVGFESKVNTNWPNKNSSRPLRTESFVTASHKWNLALKDADYFISNVNSNERIDKRITSEILAERTVTYDLSESDKATGCFSSSFDSMLLEQKAGFYLFLLPIIIPGNTPATVKSVNGSLTHKLSIKVPFENSENGKSIVQSNFELPMVRTPPSPENALADKPIYINRIWNDTLQYVITFPRKHASLGNEHIINVKVVPMKKNVVLKRIKFNILEKTTYLSQDMTQEYEYNGDGSSMIKNNGKDRVILLCDLRTKPKGQSFEFPEPFKTEIIKCPDDNLLNVCYESSSKFLSSGDVAIASSLDMNVALPFLTSRADRVFPSATFSELDKSQIRRQSSLVNIDPHLHPDCDSSPVIGTFETNIDNSNTNFKGKRSKMKLNSSRFAAGLQVDREEGSTVKSKALAPDSNFRHIQISHRLQVAFRISCPESLDNDKLHHYEIVVDTPVNLLSSKCKDESIQLPQYEEVASSLPMVTQDPEIRFRVPQFSSNGISISQFSSENDDQLPSFEEATSAPALSSHSTSITSDSNSPYSLHSVPAPAYDSGYFSYHPPMRTTRASLSPLSREYVSSDDELFSVKSNYTHSTGQLSLEDLLLHEVEEFIPKTYLKATDQFCSSQINDVNDIWAYR